MAAATANPFLTPVPTTLTSNDSAILSALFDPESSPSTSLSISKSLPPLPDIQEPLFSSLRSQEASALSELNTPSPSQASIEGAIRALSDLIKQNPTYTPAYLNRAQATRLLLTASTDSVVFDPVNLPVTKQLFADLNTVVSLSTPSTPSAPLSALQADLLAKAHTHRGYLLLKAAKAVKQVGDTPCTLPAPLANMDSEQLEEMASREFFFGGRYGNTMARQVSVQTNPYAKMCGAIVKEAMKKEREEYETLQGHGTRL